MNKTIEEKNAMLQRHYRDTMQQIKLPEQQKEQLCAAMEQGCITEPDEPGVRSGRYEMGRKKQFSYVCAAAAIALIFFMTFPEKQLINAEERRISHGVSYIRETFGDFNVNSVSFNWSEWDQTAEVKSVSDHTDWEEYYPEFFKEMTSQGLTEVMLPHFYIGEYECRQVIGKEGFMGKLGENDVSLQGYFTKGDSGYWVYISQYAGAVSSALDIDLIDQYELTVNDISYEIFKLNPSFTYEQYVTVFEARTEGRFDPPSREYFDGWMQRPVRVNVMINNVKYVFCLTEDIDVEEFINTIY